MVNVAILSITAGLTGQYEMLSAWKHTLFLSEINMYYYLHQF